MRDYVTLKVDSDDFLDMLIERLKTYWHVDNEVADLYAKMYESYIDGGVFEDAELDIKGIVDNDYVNYCSVIDSADENYQKILDLYHDNEYDISCENVGYSYIEAVSDDESLILVRC